MVAVEPLEPEPLAVVVVVAVAHAVRGGREVPKPGGRPTPVLLSTLPMAV